jgi:hypothetical protein
MLNLIPVVMLLLMQGASGQDMSLRQHQALLDLAHRVCLAQNLGELETELAAQAGVGSADLAVWIQAFSHAATVQVSPAAPDEPATERLARPRPENETATGPGWADCARPRDGPSAS